MEFKGTEDWRIRTHEEMFFIEANLPKAEKNGFYPRLEVMQEDFGEHNGYTKELRMYDALLIANSPELLKSLKLLISHYEDVINGDFSPFSLRQAIDSANELIKKATTI